MTDFGPLIANPASFLLGAAAQFGIYGAYFLAFLMGFNGKEAAAISIIGGADGPTSIFLAGKLGMGGTLLGPIFLYVTGSDHPATYYESTYNKERAPGQNATASSCNQAGKDSFPNYRYSRSCSDPSYNSTTGWYADVR